MNIHILNSSGNHNADQETEHSISPKPHLSHYILSLKVISVLSSHTIVLPDFEL